MKSTIQKGFSIRRKLIREGKSHIDPLWAEKQMQKVEYWLSTAPVETVVKNNMELIIILLPTNFISKFKAKINECEYNN